MKNLKKISIFFVAAAIAMSFAPSLMADRVTDTFDITVTGEFLWIDITNSSWDLGNVAMSSSTWTNETGITFIADMDNCTVTTDLKLQITGDGADWTSAAGAASPDADTYRLNASTDIWAADDDQVLATGTMTVSSSIPADENESFDLRFDAPTSTTVSTGQSITVTATVAKS